MLKTMTLGTRTLRPLPPCDLVGRPVVSIPPRLSESPRRRSSLQPGRFGCNWLLASQLVVNCTSSCRTRAVGWGASLCSRLHERYSYAQALKFHPTLNYAEESNPPALLFDFRDGQTDQDTCVDNDSWAIIVGKRRGFWALSRWVGSTVRGVLCLDSGYSPHGYCGRARDGLTSGIAWEVSAPPLTPRG